jgi:hypothetical protein
MEPNVDLMGGGQAQGSVANYIASNGRLDIGRMRPFIDGTTGKQCISVFKGGNPKDLKNYSVLPVTNATLRRDEWKQLDDAINMVSRYRLVGVQDLIAAGLTFNLGNAMGTTVLEWHDVSDPMEADMTMDGVTRGLGDRPVFQHNYLPIPIIHVDYEINERELSTSRNMGNGIDTTAAESAARRINEKLENMLFTNVTYSFGEKDSRNRNTIYSYVNHPDRNLVAIGTAWDQLVTTVGATIVNQVFQMKAASLADFHYGPWHLYIPANFEVTIDKDYDTVTPGTTIRERIMKIDGIKSIKVIDSLPANNVLLVQMTPDVVRLVRGFGLQNIQWGVEGNLITKFKVMTIQVPQIRSDMNKRSGIVHLA